MIDPEHQNDKKLKARSARAWIRPAPVILLQIKNTEVAERAGPGRLVSRADGRDQLHNP